MWGKSPKTRLIFTGPMEHTVKELRSCLVSLIREIGRELRRFARGPDRDFTRRQKLNMETLIAALLCLGCGSLGQKLLVRFDQAAPSVSASVQQRDNLLPLAMKTTLHRRTGNIGSVGMAIASWLLDGMSLKTAPYPTGQGAYLPGTPAQHGCNQSHLNVLL